MNKAFISFPKALAGIAFAALLAMGAPVASAQTFLHEGIVYKASGNKLEVQKPTTKPSNGDAPGTYTGDVVLPETIEYSGKTYTVATINSAAFREGLISSIEIPGTVTSIPKGGFQKSPNLKKVVLHEGTTEIVQLAFKGCPLLEEINIPGSVVKKISEKQFEECVSLHKITFDAGTEPLEFTSAALSLGTNDSIREVYIYRPLSDVSAMLDKPFRSGKSLRKLVVGGECTGLYASFAEGCKVLETVELGEKVASIGANCFSSSIITEIVLPDALTSVPSSAFASCKQLKKVTLGNATTLIDAMAFQNTKVAEINWPETLVTIGDMAFQNAKLSGVITLPAPVKKIGTQAFAANTGITEMNIPAATTTIGNGAFMGITNLAAINVAAENEAFKSMENGRYVLSADENTLLHYAVANPKGDLCLGLNYVAPYACYGAKNLNVIQTPHCWSFGDYCFAGTGAKNLTVRGQIGRYVAQNSLALEEVTVDGTKQMPLGLVAGCTALTKINLPEKLAVVKADAFKGCTALKEVNLGNILQIIEAGAFDNCGVETIITGANTPAVMPEGVFNSNHAGVTAKVPVDRVDAYKAAAGWNMLQIAGDANIATAGTDLGMPGGIYYAGEDGLLHGVYADGGTMDYDLGGVDHTFQLLEFSNRIYGACAGKKFVYSATGATDGDGQLFYISKVDGNIFQAVVLDNTGNNAYMDPFGLYIYDDILYVNDRNVALRKIPASAISLPQNYPSWVENNWMFFYGVNWSYGCIKAGFAITQTKDEANNDVPLYWVGMKYNGNGIFRFRDSNVGTGADVATKGTEPVEKPFFTNMSPILTTFNIDEKNGHLYVYFEKAGNSVDNMVKGGLYRVNIADVEANPSATNFADYNPVLVDGAPVFYEGSSTNEHVGISQLYIDKNGEYMYWCYRAPTAADVEAREAKSDMENFTSETGRYAWAEKYDANNPLHQDGIKRIKLGEANPVVEMVVPGVRGYGVVETNYVGSTTPEAGVVDVVAPETKLVAVANGAIVANEEVNLDVFNTAGLLVARVQLAAGEAFSTDALEAGIYVAAAYTEAQSQTLKFVK